jgi:NAD(P)-dependent dehydrogenase (short-subunit alcohol dehydrogenase family)
MKRFEGKIAVVSGAGSGIGRATASRLAAEGAEVACSDVADAACEDTVKAIVDAGGAARAYHCDVSDEGSVAGYVDAVVADYGPPRVLCNIAGIGKFSHTHEMSLADWQRIIDVNLTGTFLMSRAVLPHLLENGGCIVNVSSSAGVFGQPYSAAYGASKGGVSLMTRAMAYEYVKQGVRINAVAPGAIATAIHESFDFPEGSDPKLFYKIMAPDGSFGSPDDVAALIAFLASDEAHYMTGAIVPIDRGMTC